MYLLFDKKWENVVMTLELHRFYTIHCIYLVYGEKYRPPCVLSFGTKYVCIGVIMAKLPAAKVGHLKNNKNNRVFSA